MWFEARQLSRRTHVVEEFLRHHIAHAVGCAAGAGIFAVIDQIVTIIKREFLTWLDVAIGDDPKPAILSLSVAISRATVVDVPRRIPFHAAVQVLPFIERENVWIIFRAAAQ